MIEDSISILANFWPVNLRFHIFGLKFEFEMTSMEGIK